MDLTRLTGELRKLSPLQEKVVRPYLGLGCERSHSAREITGEFDASVQAIAAILGAAQRRLAAVGLTSGDLREAARCQGKSHQQLFRRIRHSHRR